MNRHRNTQFEYDRQPSYWEGEREVSQQIDRLLRSTNGTLETVDIINRATRSLLVSKKLHKPEDLHDTATNCFGSFLHLQGNLSQYGLHATPAIVLRYPWQQPETVRGIHIVATISNYESSDVVIADPTPMAGYMYGTTKYGKISDTDHYQLTQFDETLRGHTSLKVLTPSEFKGIEEVYKYETSLGSSAYTQQDFLSILDSLREVPGYTARMLHLLVRRNEGYIFNTMMHQLSPASLRKSYTQNLAPNIQEYVDAALEDEYRNINALQSDIDRALEDATTINNYTYWSAVRAQLTLNRENQENNLSKLNPRIFASQGSLEPIRDYEAFIVEHAPHMAVSNLYISEW